MYLKPEFRFQVSRISEKNKFVFLFFGRDTVQQFCFESTDLYLLKFFLCASLICDFSLLSHFSKKLRFSYIFQNFLFGFWIWFWALGNLGSSHHVSVVPGLWWPQAINLSNKRIESSFFQCGIFKRMQFFPPGNNEIF